MKKYSIHFDGAVHQNIGKPSPIGFGFAVFVGDREIACDCGTAEKLATSNIAEWTALCCALEWATKNVEDWAVVEIYGDSQLIVNQFNGEFKVKNETFLPYYNLCATMRECLGMRFVKVDWVPREHPKQRRADVLSKEGLAKYFSS